MPVDDSCRRGGRGAGAMARRAWACRRAASWTRVAPLVAVIGMGLAARPSLAKGELYVKKDSLQQTMLDVRARLRDWQAAQLGAWRAVKASPWHGVTLGGQKLDGADLSKPGAPPASAAKTALPQWNPWSGDGSGGFFSVEALPADFLATTIQAERPVTLTLELSRYEWFGGFAYRPQPSGAGVQASDALVWLNGRQVELRNKLEGYQRVPVAKRRGWHERYAWHDAVLVDLALQRGENRLVVTLHKPPRMRWFNSVRLVPRPAPALWPMIENDFPRSGNRLLEQVAAQWFDAESGWFAQVGSVQLERQFLEDLTKKLGADGEAVRRRLDELVKAQAAPSDARWLDLCVAAAELHAALGQADALRAAVEELRAAYGQGYPGERLLGRIADLRGRLLVADRLDPAHDQTRRLLAEMDGLKREALVASNPLLAGKKLLLVKRYSYDSDHYYDEHNSGISRFGGGLYTLSLGDGAVAEIAPQLRAGVVDRYDLSFDGRRIVFGYKPPKPEGFRLFEIGVDGRGLRQLTFPPGDESQRIATYSMISRDDLQKNPARYGHWTDDKHPCYLPDGRIVFTSTRTERGVLCGGHALTVTNLHRINADGSGLERLSQGALSEFCPTVMNDGRILYNRWEYVDKGAGAAQWLWAMGPDGSRSEEIGGSSTSVPPVLNQARHVPGCNNLVVCLGAGHCPGNMGAIVLLDLHKSKRSEEAMRVLTPGSLPKGNWGLRQMRNGRWIMDVYGPWYCDPFPLADPGAASVAGKFFLVSCNPEGLWNDPAGYGIYLLDVFGNRVPIYRDPEISCWEAMPLEPRPTPSLVASAPRPAEVPETGEATVVVADVYQGLDGVAPGSVKYLRVMEQVARPWSVYVGYQANDAAPGEMMAISLYTHLSVKVLHGIVPVREDGSAHFTVPADRNIFLQALDKDFMEIQRMRTFVNFQPGERRSCIGCHERRNRVPANRRLAALDGPPARPQAQPGEIAPRPLHYPTDIQPIFDRHCVSCHNDKRRDGNLDLSGAMTELFCQSYEDLIRKDQVSYIQEFIGPKPQGAEGMGYAAAVPPYTYGSHKSKLIAVLRAGHYDVKLPREEFIRLVTWVDANAPYYGSYFGRRNIAYRDRADFRPIPTLEAALGTAPVARRSIAK